MNVNPLTLDDFEWAEDGFDRYVLQHKTIEISIAAVSHFNGWRVNVWKENRFGEPVVADALDLDAAKAIALLYANQHMEEYTNVIRRNSYSRRAPKPVPGKIPKGVFKLV